MITPYTCIDLTRSLALLPDVAAERINTAHDEAESGHG